LSYTYVLCGDTWPVWIKLNMSDNLWCWIPLENLLKPIQ
jgi:hypothetical protein